LTELFVAEQYKVTLPTECYYTDEVECRTGCPVNTDARGYLIAVSEGRLQEGYAISRATNPFASICLDLRQGLRRPLRKGLPAFQGG
jgi:NADPH-dependent glutamate synthase beta subunit-like oxidoreductase